MATGVIAVDDPWVGAACRDPGVDPNIFFLEPGQSAKPARAVCRRCPLQRPCFLYAMTTEANLPRGSRHGIFAGTTPGRRAALAEKGWGQR